METLSEDHQADYMIGKYLAYWQEIYPIYASFEEGEKLKITIRELLVGQTHVRRAFKKDVKSYVEWCIKPRESRFEDRSSNIKPLTYRGGCV